MRADSLVVHEIFTSLQGESTWAGTPCTFARLTGCNLRCAWCDTPQAFRSGTRMARAEVLARVLAGGTGLVEVTGGEPLLQPGTLPLLAGLCDAGRTVLLETSGERDLAPVDPRVHRIMDLKAPGSGMVARNRWSNVDLLTRRDEVKIVLASEEDYLWARAAVRTRRLADRAGAVLLSTVAGTVEPRQVVAWMLRDRLPARFQLQMHKVLWPPGTPGV